MESLVGENAGRLWHHLSQTKVQTPAAAAKALNLQTADVDRSIGWLAREGKIAIEKDARGIVRISLK